MHKVFVVVAGEKHEGGSIKGVYASEYKAGTAALRVPTVSGEWKLVEEFAGQTKPGMVSARWESGCDFVQVECHEVHS